MCDLVMLPLQLQQNCDNKAYEREGVKFNDTFNGRGCVIG